MFQNVFMLSSFDLHFLLQFGCYPLWYAVRWDKLDICKLLLEHGADVNCINKVVQCDLCYGYATMERIPAWIWSGRKVTYQLYFPAISEHGAISLGLGT